MNVNSFYRLVFLTIFSALICSQHTFALTNPLDTAKSLNQFQLDHWKMEDGLPSNSIMAMLKSSSGYFWLATYDGLARFDGWSFKVFNQATHPQFPTNSLLNLLEDKAGNLWIATNGGGLLKMQNESFTLMKANANLPNQTITSLAEDGEGNIWVGTRGGLALVKNDSYVSFSEFDRLNRLHIFTLFIDSKDNLWIGTVGEGLWKLSNGTLTQYLAGSGLVNNSVRSIFEDSKGRLWIGTEEGISLMEEEELQPVEVFDKPFQSFVNDIEQDTYGSLWFATDAGLLRYFNGTFKLLETDPEGGTNELQNILEDGQGSLWVGTYHEGLMRLRDGKFQNFTSSEGLPNDVVNAVWADSVGVWLGTNGGMAYINQGVERVYMLDNNSAANRIRDIYRDKEGTLWVGTYDGMFKEKGGRFVRTFQKGSGLSSDKIRRILEDKDGNLLIGTRNGLFVQLADSPEKVTIVDELAGAFILSLYLDSSQRLWVSTNGMGIYCLTDASLTHYTTENGLGSDIVFDVWQDKEGNLWACSNAGISVLRDGQWDLMNEKNGLFENTLFQILPDKQDNLWLTSSRGVYFVRRKDLLALADRKINKIRNFKLFTSSDGLLGSEITAASISRESSNGFFWFPTLKGVSAIHPSRILTNHMPPVVRMEQVVVDKKEYSPATQPAFDAGSRHYEFHFTGFNYFAPKATKFSYKLEGFDTEWQQVGSRRVAFYTNLPAGNYTFKVRAANEDGVWSEEDAQFAFTQEAFFYDTAWFKALLGIGLLLVIGIGFYFRLRSLHAQNEVLSKLVNQRTSRIQQQKDAIEDQKEELSRLNQLKDKLLSVLSHDLRQPFSSISALLALLKERQINQQEFQHFSSELYQQVKWQVHMLDNILLWTRNQLKGIEIKLVEINLFQTVEEVFQLYQAQAGFKNIRLVNRVSDEVLVQADEDILHLIIRNLIGNAIKFTQKNGLISISASVRGSYYTVEVTDNGVGIEKEGLSLLFKEEGNNPARGTFNEKGTGLGLVMCKEFVEACGGRIWAESQQGVGSRFYFELPQRPANAAKKLSQSPAKAIT